MNSDVQKYTRQEIETLEVAPGFAHEVLEGSTADLSSEQATRAAIEKAFDYRGDVTLLFRTGEVVECYVFNRYEGATLAESWLQYFVAGDEAKRKASYDQVKGLVFSGKDRAAGKHWEDWVKAYNERKAAGEQNIRIEADALE